VDTECTIPNKSTAGDEEVDIAIETKKRQYFNTNNKSGPQGIGEGSREGVRRDKVNKYRI